MAGIFVQEGAAAVLRRLADAAALQMFLFKSDTVPTGDTVLGDLTPADFSGYDDANLQSGGDWGSLLGSGAVSILEQATLAEFSCDGSGEGTQDIYGWGLKGDGAGSTVLYYAERFDSPITVDSSVEEPVFSQNEWPMILRQGPGAAGANTGVFPREGTEAVLRQAVEGLGMYFALFQSDTVPTAGTVIGDLTKADFSGYDDVNANGLAEWTVEKVTGTLSRAVFNGPAMFASDGEGEGTQTVYGVFLFGTETGSFQDLLFWARRFETPIAVDQAQAGTVKEISFTWGLKQREAA